MVDSSMSVKRKAEEGMYSADLQVLCARSPKRGRGEAGQLLNPSSRMMLKPHPSNHT